MRRHPALPGLILSFAVATTSFATLDAAHAQQSASLSVMASSTAVGELRPGDRATHTITVINDGATEVRGVGLTAELSPAVRVANLVPPFDGGTCSVFSESGAGGRIVQTVHCERRSLPAGAQATATIIVEVVDDPPCGPSLDRVHVAARDLVDAPDHLVIITDHVACRPAVELRMEAPRYATEGSLIQVAFVVRNHGDVALEDVVVASAGCRRSPTGPTDDGPLAPGRERRYVCVQEVTAGERHLATGAVAASGDGERVRDAASTEVDVIHPELQISVRRSGMSGDLMRLTYRVANTGDTTIRSIRLTDNVAGPDATIASLAPGASDVIVRDVPAPGTRIDVEVHARGLDLSGRSVTAATSTSIRSHPSADDQDFTDTPFTGLDADDAAALSLLLLLVGSLALLTPRRRATG